MTKSDAEFASRPRRRISRLVDRAIDHLAGLGAILIVGAMLVVASEVAMRYFLRRPQLWVIEMSEYALVWITFLGAPWLLQAEGHVRVDFLYNHLGPKGRTLADLVGGLVCILVCLVLVVYGTRVTWAMALTWEADSKSQIGVPKAPLMAIIPLSSLLLLVQFIRKSLKSLRDWRDKRGQRGKE